MPTRTRPHNTLVLGEWIAICDVCGFRFHSGDLRERWDGMMVCRDDWEERHPSDFFRATPDDQTVPWTSPADSESGGTDVNGNTFPPAENTTQTDLGTQVDTNGDNIPDGTFGDNNGTL